MITEKELKELIIKLLLALFPGAVIYLFGSRSRSTHTVRSDFDLAIDNNGQPVSLQDISLASRVLEAINVPQKIDVVDFNSVSDVLQKEILKEGIIWKAKNG